jgi:hypothetical protein
MRTSNEIGELLQVQETGTYVQGLSHMSKVLHLRGKSRNCRKTKTGEKEEPPSYDSLLKQINACSMEDRQKILEVFSQDRSESEDF